MIHLGLQFVYSQPIRIEVVSTAVCDKQRWQLALWQLGSAAREGGRGCVHMDPSWLVFGPQDTSHFQLFLVAVVCAGLAALALCAVSPKQRPDRNSVVSSIVMAFLRCVHLKRPNASVCCIVRPSGLAIFCSLVSPPLSLDCFAMLRSASFAPSRHRAGGATTREQLCTRCVDTEAAWRCKQGDAERSLSSWMRAWSR